MPSFDKNDTKFNRINLIKIFISGAAIYLIFNSVDGSTVLSLIKEAEFLYICFAITVIFITRFIMALKWKLLLHHAGITQPLFFLLKVIIISSFFGFFLPSSVGVDVIRTVAVSKRTGLTAAAVSTIADRIIAIITMILWSSIAAGIALRIFPAEKPTLMVVLVFCCFIFASVLLLLSKSVVRLVLWIGRVCQWRSGNTRGRYYAGIIERLGHFVNIAARKSALLHEELRNLLAKPRAFVSAFLLNALVQWARILLFYLLFLACDVHIPFIYHIIFVPIIIFLSLMPISFLGIGIKEGACVFFYSQIGVIPASALAISLWTYLVSLPVLITGGLLFAAGELTSIRNIDIQHPSSKDGF